MCGVGGMQCLMVREDAMYGYREDAMFVVEGGDAMLDGEGGCNVWRGE